MNKTFFGLVMFFFLSFQQSQNDEIFWRADYQLKWEDFKGPTISNSKHAAISNVGIYKHFELNEDTCVLVIEAIFRRDESWVKPNQKSKSLLKHEQGHYDITEIYARKIRKSILEQNITNKTAEKICDEQYNKIRKDFLKRQSLYDMETDRSKSQIEQKKWDEVIAEELTELEDYKESVLKISLSE